MSNSFSDCRKALYSCHTGMPKGPQGQKRPADAVSRAIMVAKIATGEVEDERDLSSAAAELGRKGGKTRAERLTPERRSAIARKAAAKRWKAVPEE